MRKVSKNYLKENSDLRHYIRYWYSISYFLSPKFRGVAETGLARFLLVADYHSRPAICNLYEINKKYGVARRFGFWVRPAGQRRYDHISLRRHRSIQMHSEPRCPG